MLRNQTWLDQTSTLGYNVAGTWNNLGYKNDPTTTTAAHVGNHKTRVIAGDAQAWPFKSTGLFLKGKGGIEIQSLKAAFARISNLLRKKTTKGDGGYGIPGCGQKINCIQMKLPNFENWSNGELSKSTKI